MRRRGNYWWFLFLFLIFGGYELIPIAIFGIAIYFIVKAILDNQKQENTGKSTTYYRRKTSSYAKTAGSRLSPAEMAKINIYLRSWFKTHTSLEIAEGYDLRLSSNGYSNLGSLMVYRDDVRICSMADFSRRYPSTYEEILGVLQNMSNSNPSAYQGNVIDVEVEEHTTPTTQKEEQPTPQEDIRDADHFIRSIESLSEDITDDEVKEQLYETRTLLLQIKELSEKFPDSKPKLKRLYEYYMPILVSILEQYEDLQAAKTDPSYEDTRSRLIRTVGLINDAMETIISSLTDQDFINLSADISTLEAVLQKDGLAGDGRMETKHGDN